MAVPDATGRGVNRKTSTASTPRAPANRESSLSRSRANRVYGGTWRAPRLPGGRGRPCQGQIGLTARSAGLRLSGAEPIPLDQPVHVLGERVSDGGALDLEHVFGILLAAVGEVEAADEHGVVGNEALRMHEVVH